VRIAELQNVQLFAGDACTAGIRHRPAFPQGTPNRPGCRRSKKPVEIAIIDGSFGIEATQISKLLEIPAADFADTDASRRDNQPPQSQFQKCRAIVDLASH